tara:strand:- start:565 stop:849 length:285 start_codon:yes stop_codon:yes gene_type:complete
MNELAKVYDVLTKITSEDGYKVDKYLIKMNAPIEAKISMPNEGVFDLNFVGNLPVVTFKKIIRMSVDVLGITLKNGVGIIKIDNFPDVEFKYEK